MSRTNGKLTIKGIIWGLVILAVTGFLLNGYLKNSAKEKAEREKAEQHRQQIGSALNELVSQFNAVDDWEKELSKGEGVRTSKILTIELEKIWIHERPVLFCGAIEDISTFDTATYHIRLERGLFRNIEHLFFTKLALDLRCSKAKIDDFLKDHPQLFSNLGLNNNVATIARINRIKTEAYSDQEGSRQEIRVGVGDCLAIMHLGQIRF